MCELGTSRLGCGGPECGEEWFVFQVDNGTISEGVFFFLIYSAIFRATIRKI